MKKLVLISVIFLGALLSTGVSWDSGNIIQQDTSKAIKNQNTIIKNQNTIIKNQDTLKKNDETQKKNDSAQAKNNEDQIINNAAQTNVSDKTLKVREMIRWQTSSKKMDKNFDIMDQQGATMDSLLLKNKPPTLKKKIK